MDFVRLIVIAVVTYPLFYALVKLALELGEDC